MKQQKMTTWNYFYIIIKPVPINYGIIFILYYYKTRAYEF